MIFYAHSIENQPPEKWQLLEDHLANVAEMAEEFAHPFGGCVWSRLAGRNHDIGKGKLPWQAYLRHENQIIDGFTQ